MENTKQIPFWMALFKVALHLPFLQHYGYHRDELLYLTLGRHLDWGYWSNPPLIGCLTWLQQHLLGDALWISRLVAALMGAALVYLTGLLAAELGGGRKAQFLACLGVIVSIVFLRTGGLLQPVPLDVFFWTLSFYFLVRFINRQKEVELWWLGLSLGLGLLTKYLIGLWIVGLLIATLLTPNRKLLKTRGPYLALGISLLLLLPNLIWQWAYDFPVVNHLSGLAENQLVHVRPFDFILEQLLMPFMGTWLWLPGLIFLLGGRLLQPYRPLGWMALFVFVSLLLMGGKSYYTAGLFPMLFAAGGLVWEQILRKSWQLAAFTGLLVLGTLPILPTGMPVLKIDAALRYFNWLTYDMGIEGPVRWEDGHLHPLPQDFADMRGWDELAQLVEVAIEEAAVPYLIYCENYGQAAAVDLYGHGRGWTPVVSFSDTYRLWLPDCLPDGFGAFIYVNDELGEDVQAAFGDIQVIGILEDPYARERGTTVYLCREPKGFETLMNERLRTIRATFGQ
ncbi:MAG: glycosyltransferase family 39 protein [Phaeodactylibacter sp.]|nr:glycosyltransferase family 39 protein [Phaeodactylibacter sp.]